MRRVKVLESRTEQRSIDYACGTRKKHFKDGRGCIHYKGNGLGRMAKPDQIFVTPNGYVWWVEFKREGEEPTRLQELEAEKLIERYQFHAFIDTFEEFKFKLEWILALPPVRKVKWA